MSSIENNLAELRRQRGLSAAQLAREGGVSRQTIYAIEAGTYVPNTAVALRLARALESSVENLFTLPQQTCPPAQRGRRVNMLEGAEPLEPGQPVQLCSVDGRLIASPPSPVQWYFPESDAVIAGKAVRRGMASVQVFPSGSDFRNRILIAGCDPGISVLSRHVQAAGIELVLAHRNSSQALKLLKNGFVHIAGTHLRDETSGESNIPAIGRIFRSNSVAVISFAMWEEGIVTARGNPKSIRGIEDFARKEVRIVNREAGAGSRILLDTRLKRLKLDARSIAGYDATARGHLAAAWQVQCGEADCCIATRAAARMFGLGFIPLATERYDLALKRQHLDLPLMQALLETLSRSAFRRELESLGGYDTRAAGDRML